MPRKKSNAPNASPSNRRENPSADLSGQDVEDVLKALLKTPPAKDDKTNREQSGVKTDCDDPV